MLIPSDLVSQDVNIRIFWVGTDASINHPIDTINNPIGMFLRYIPSQYRGIKVIVMTSFAVTLYDCREVATDCSRCVRSRDTSGFQCGWCGRQPSICTIDEECMDSLSSPPLLTTGQQCPSHVITGFSPSSGPPSGGTIITIRGSDLGVTFDDFSPPSGITVGGVACTPLNMDYRTGTQVLCQTEATLPEGSQVLEVTLRRSSGQTSIPADDPFLVVTPTVLSVVPDIGPIAGGSILRVNGTGLDISDNVRVILGGVNGEECLGV